MELLGILTKQQILLLIELDRQRCCIAPEDMLPSQSRSVREINIDALVHATKLTVGKREHLEHYLKRLTRLTLNGDAKKAFRKIENLHHCPNLKVLYLYDNEIQVIENLDFAPQLTHLHLQNNQIQKIESLDGLPQLEKVYLEGNRIARLEGLQNCCYVQELHLSTQQLPPTVSFSFDMQTLQVLSRSLRILNLSGCHVASAAPLAMLRGLEQLDLSKNSISELEDVFGLLSSLTALTELDLRLNSVTNTPKYREKAITFSSPRLVLLDKKNIDANQRRMMQSHLAHKYRKRQEAPERPSSDGGSNLLNEMRRTMKRGLAVHQLRSMQISSSGMAKSAKAQFEREGLGVEGASCSPSGSSSVASSAALLVRSSHNNNNRHH